MPTPESIRFLIVVIPITLMIVGIRIPLYAAIGYMVFVYCNTSYHYPIFVQFNAELVFALIILSRILLDPKCRTRFSFQYNRINTYMFLFSLSIGLSYMFSWNYEVSWNYGVYHFIKTAILYSMLIMSLGDEKDLKTFTWSFILMFAYLAYEPTYRYITKTGADIQMYGEIYISEVGLLSGHVALANNMNQMIPLAFFLIFSFKERYKKALATIPLIVFMTALIGSGSRGGVLGFLFFGLILIFFSRRRLRTAMIVGAVTGALFFTSGMFVSTAERIDTGQTWGRFMGLLHGIDMVKKGNILGVGPGCFAIARGKYYRFTMDSHNIYGQLIGELGIPGMIVWFFLMRETFLNLARSKRLLKTMAMEKSFYYLLASGIQASLIVRLFISMASHGLYYFYWYTLAAMSAAMFVAVKKMSDDAISFKALSPV